MTSSTNYHSYLVRLWRDHPQTPWRASAHCVQTGATFHFASVVELTSFLKAQTTEHPEQAPQHQTR